ncbi:MAG: heme exporter protein CcmD [Hyphomonadaceae bacterium]|jgi:heme exporter protein D|uniref:heme exporter protein CcmD n=1 Tax=Aquidulcibacter sp. TaxID=2052990 RepID=UPI0022C8FC9D|nr:heme exporter protein CcmD [Aquidulcibacter sp.]MCZ8207926.1 heme exporter protein CcmD [Aquidulcibacter sp.]
MIPQFASFAEFLAMGGYAGFVWGAWGLSVAVIAGLILRASVSGRNQKARLEALRQEKDAGTSS